MDLSRFLNPDPPAVTPLDLPAGEPIKPFSQTIREAVAATLAAAYEQPVVPPELAAAAGRVSIGPAGTEPTIGDSRWRDVGYAPHFTIDQDGSVWDGWGPLRAVTHPDVPEDTAAIVGIDAGPIQLSMVDDSDRAWNTAMATFRAEQWAAMQVVNAKVDALLFYGDGYSEPRTTLTIRYERSTRPVAPQRLPWSTARRYRAARRRYGRQLRAWKRAGRPTTPEQVHLPNVNVELIED